VSQPRVKDPFQPTVATAGSADALKQFKLVGREGDEFAFTGIRLGHETSYQDQHTHHPRRAAAKREKCSACRWFEVSIYRRYLTESVDLKTNTDQPRIYPIDPVPGDYVVHTVGASNVPNEQRLSRIAVTESAFEIVELLTVRKIDEQPFITVQSSRALAQAAARDEDVRDAYINRAVV
jgi:hypothetical protein